jgi:ABC-type multidrug transport system fused ATPase/permease subunit
MTSVERIIEYTNIKGENLKQDIKKVDRNWPSEGKIEFENVSYAYDENLPNVLQNITLKINSKEKIGIIGRTGAGKSTFFQALYRMAEPSGKILIDNVNIKDVSLHELRSIISIIPVSITLFFITQ